MKNCIRWNCAWTLTELFVHEIRICDSSQADDLGIIKEENRVEPNLISVVDEELESFFAQESRVVEVGDDEKLANVGRRQIRRQMRLAL